MESTRVSLLLDASSGSELAWSRLVVLYKPLVYGWLRRHEVAHHDAEELTQDVLGVVVKELPEFCHSGRKGAFRHWLRQVTVNRAKGFWRAGKCRPTAAGGSRFLKMVEQLADQNSDLSRRWDREHDQCVLRGLMANLNGRFEPTTLAAFRRQVFDRVSAQEVAAELGITLVAAYTAKSRVIRRLRADAAGLVDESFFS